MVRNCAPENPRDPGSGPSDHPGMTERLLFVSIFIFALVLLLVLVLFLLLALAIAVFIGIVAVIVGHLFVFEHLHRLELLRFQRRALGGLLFTLLAIVFVGVEDQMQPRHHLLDRRQLPGRSGFAAGADRTLRARLALRPRFATRALWSGFARCTGLALRPRLAAAAIGAAPSGMALRAEATRLALLAAWAGRSRRCMSALPGRRIIGHVLLLHASIQGDFLADVH